MRLRLRSGRMTGSSLGSSRSRGRFRALGAPPRARRYLRCSPARIGDSILEETPAAAHLEAAEFRRTLGMFATGVTVITTRVGEQIHGMTANAFMSVSLQPPLILISVARRDKVHP